MSQLIPTHRHPAQLRPEPCAARSGRATTPRRSVTRSAPFVVCGDDSYEARRPPGVHAAAWRCAREAATVLLIRLSQRWCRRPRSVHGPLERERVEERDGVFAAVIGEVAVVTVDHGDARPHETRDCEHKSYPNSLRRDLSNVDPERWLDIPFIQPADAPSWPASLRHARAQRPVRRTRRHGRRIAFPRRAGPRLRRRDGRRWLAPAD